MTIRTTGVLGRPTAAAVVSVIRMFYSFKDRDEAGHLLAGALVDFKETRSVVLALPRGGVPVACQVAKSLSLPIEVLVVRKLGVPNNEEFAFGAISEAGAEVINEGTVRALGISKDEISAALTREHQILESRVKTFRGSDQIPSVTGRTALIIDDGLATGATAQAACIAARRLGATRVVVAVPVSPRGVTREQLGCDEFIALRNPTLFNSVGEHYEHFDQVTDEEVKKLMSRT